MDRTLDDEREPRTVHVTTRDDPSVDPAQELEEPSPLHDRAGRYTLLDEIGSGGMGRVVRAYDPQLQREVAVKLLHVGSGSRGAAAGRARARLVREAQAMARLSHVNVATVFDVVSQGEHVCIAMELIHGVTLSKWLAQSPSDREILEVFRAAGRGLEAAHDAGIVHRDFKPANVMISCDAEGTVSRVCVLDFGLARAMAEPLPTPTDDDVADTSRSSSLDGVLTQVGLVLGTPAYMAPEQHRGGASSAQTDQYAFCVALFEALAGQRPFRAADIEGLHARKSALKTSTPLPHRLSPRIRDAILRGLQPEPSARWPRMAALLERLESATTPEGRTKWVGGIGATVALAAFGLLRTPAEDCDARGQAEAWWSAAEHDEVRAAFGRAAGSSGVASFDGIAPELEARADAWVDARAAACRGDDRLAPGHRDQRLACLAEQRRVSSALVSVLRDADETTVRNAAAAVARLPDSARCVDPEHLDQAEVADLDPRSVAERAQTRELIARSRALVMAGKYPEAAEVARRAVEAARGVEAPRLVARASFFLGRALGFAGEYFQSEDALSESFFMASQAGDLELAFLAADSLVFIVGGPLGRTSDAEAWAERAGTNLASLPHDPLRKAKLEHSIGAVLRLDDPHGAREHLERSITFFDEHYRGDTSKFGMPFANLGATLIQLEDYEAAVKVLEQARDSLAEEYDPDHPQLSVVNTNLGTAIMHAGDPEAALPPLRRGLAIADASLVRGHDQHGFARHHLGRALLKLERFDEAVPMLEGAVERFGDMERGPRFGASALIDLGEARLGAGQIVDAASAIRRAITMYEEGEHESEALGRARIALAEALWAAPDKRDEARAAARRARDDLERAGEPTEPADQWLAAHP